MIDRLLSNLKRIFAGTKMGVLSDLTDWLVSDDKRASF